MTSQQSLWANKARTTLISDPYVATTGRLILLISSPIFDENGNYAGFVGGTIYLEQDNVLSRLLSEHFYGNGSYLYVVDPRRHIIFHPDKHRINEVIGRNSVIDKVLMTESGSQEVENTEGESFFAGYAYEPVSGWGIVSQTPTSVLTAPLKKLIFNVILQTLPLFALILLIVWLVADRISRPLYRLAKFSEEALSSGSVTAPKIPFVNSTIYEVNQLYSRFTKHMNQLNTEIQLDGLTGLANRKTFDATIKEWVLSKESFGLILLDMDHFKSVNDRFGHLKGDEVIKYIASNMRSISREQDLCFRYGGEEFGILVRQGVKATALDIAERLVKAVRDGVTPTGEPITISIGLACSSGGETLPEDIIAIADSALYRSKIHGRNRITAA